MLSYKTTHQALLYCNRRKWCEKLLLVVPTYRTPGVRGLISLNLLLDLKFIHLINTLWKQSSTFT